MVRVRRSLIYGPDLRHRLDVYQSSPEDDHLRPLLLYLYGGSWKWGSRRHYELLGRALARLGYVVVIPDYRFYPQVKFPDFNHDAAEALAWAANRADELRIDLSNVTLFGHSAGAHMAACLTLDPAYLKDQLQIQIRQMVGIAGPYSTDMSQIDSVSDIFAHVPDTDKTRPIKMVAEAQNLPRFLLLHGTEDDTVNVRNSQFMSEALRDRGADVTAHFFDKVGHIDILVRAMPGLRGFYPIWPRIRSFLEIPARNIP